MPRTHRAAPAPAAAAKNLADGFQCRELSLRASSLNVEERSIEALFTTESPVLMPDWERMAMIPEVLLSSGAEWPKSRQIPLLDSHQRWTTATQLGSGRGIQKTDAGIVGRIYFSTAAEDAWTKVREGHVTDVSAGYEVLKRVYIPEGETRKISGHEFSGPVNVVTKWRLREISVTPIGADQQAKLRGLNPAVFTDFELKEEFDMNPELRTLLESRGMPKDHTDEEAQRWLLANVDKLGDQKPPEGQRKEPPTGGTGGNGNPIGLTADEVRKLITDAVVTSQKHAEDARRAFVAEVNSLCELADLPADVAATCRELPDLAAVRAKLIDEKKKRADILTPHVRISGEGRDTLVAEMRTALVVRAMDSVARPVDELALSDDASKRRERALEKVYPAAQRTKGYARWRHATLFDLASEYVRAIQGVDTRGMSREDVAICAMFGPEKIGQRGHAVIHTTGSFPNLTLDAVNKAMMLGYVETPSTWEGPMRRAASVPDFKEIQRVRMGAIPNLPLWPDNKDPEKASFADAREHYGIESRSLEIGFSYRLLVNDDMDSISRVPGMMGSAARRTVNAVAWAQVTSNPNLSDSVALFAAATGARKRTNLTTGAGAPSVSTLQTLTNLMQQMRGENTPEGAESADILNIQPRYLVGPSALRTTILQLVLSVYDPASANMIYNTASNLVPVIEPLLDVASTTAWYLFADPSQADTVEVTFLQGQENPIVRNFMDERNLSQNFTVLQTFAAKAMNHRGVQKHAGA